MAWETFLQALNFTSKDRYVQFVAEKSGNCCETCKKYDGKKFKENDPNKPKLPLHPNCRCKYVSVPEQKTEAASKIKQFVKNLPEATQTTMEMKYLPTGVGEAVGAIKIASVMATDIGLWFIRARNAIMKSRLDDTKQTDLLLKIETALEKNDITTIIEIYKKVQ